MSTLRWTPAAPSTDLIFLVNWGFEAQRCQVPDTAAVAPMKHWARGELRARSGSAGCPGRPREEHRNLRKDGATGSTASRGSNRREINTTPIVLGKRFIKIRNIILLFIKMLLSPAYGYKTNVRSAVDFPVYPIARNELQGKQAGASYQCFCYSSCMSWFKIINRLLIFFFFFGQLTSMEEKS